MADTTHVDTPEEELHDETELETQEAAETEAEEKPADTEKPEAATPADEPELDLEPYVPKATDQQPDMATLIQQGVRAALAELIGQSRQQTSVQGDPFTAERAEIERLEKHILELQDAGDDLKAGREQRRLIRLEEALERKAEEHKTQAAQYHQQQQLAQINGVVASNVQATIADNPSLKGYEAAVEMIFRRGHQDRFGNFAPGSAELASAVKKYAVDNGMAYVRKAGPRIPAQPVLGLGGGGTTGGGAVTQTGGKFKYTPEQLKELHDMGWTDEEIAKYPQNLAEL